MRMRWWWWWRCALAKRKVGRGVGPKPETELLWLSLGRAVQTSDRGQSIGVVWWCVQGGSGGGGAVHSRNTRQGEVWAKNLQPSCRGSVAG